nr:hypothetical protein [Schwartzia sp. (in: firmicutes)]
MFAQNSLLIDIDGDITAVGNYTLHGGVTNGVGRGYICSAGGAFHGNDEATITANNMLFEENHSGRQGGAVCTNALRPITLVAVDSMTFRGNSAGLSADIKGDAHDGQGGAVQTNGVMRLEAGGTILFENNRARGFGGAICAGNYNTGRGLTMKADKLIFRGNSSLYAGGAVLAGDGGTFEAADTILFEQNHARLGGAVRIESGPLTMNAKSIIFRNNEAAGENAQGGVLYVRKGNTPSSHLISADTIEFSQNKAQYANSLITDSAGTFSIRAKELTFRENRSQRTTQTGIASGALFMYTDSGSIDIEADHIQFAKNTAEGIAKARAAGLRYDGTQTATLTGAQHFYEDNAVLATGEGGEARGGFAYALRPLFINATEGALFKNNTATAPQGTALGGAIWASSDVTITMGDENTIGDLVFNGNSATGADGMGLGGAIYSENGDITLRRGSDLGAVFDFATATDDVFARSGNIFIEGMLIAKPGTSFAAGNGVIFGEGSTLTVQGFVSKDDVNMSDMALFGGHELSFNRAKLTLTDYDKLVPVPDPDNPQSSRHYKIDVVSVLVNENFAQHVLGGAASADVTNEDWALDIKNYRRGKLWLDTAVVPDADSQRLSAELGLTQNAKLVLEFDRHSLIWNGQPGDVWKAANDSKQVWLMAKEDDIFSPE